jgi:hypothetical protein
MQNVAEQLAQLEARKLNILQEQKLAQAAAADHLQQSQEHNRSYFRLKAEAEQVDNLIQAAKKAGLEQQALDKAAQATAAAEQAKASHDEMIARLEEKEKRLDAALARAEKPGDETASTEQA